MANIPYYPSSQQAEQFYQQPKEEPRRERKIITTESPGAHRVLDTQAILCSQTQNTQPQEKGCCCGNSCANCGCGTAGGIYGYAGLYNAGQLTLELPAQQQFEIPLSSELPHSPNMACAPPAITVSQPGDYKLEYYIAFTPQDNSTINFSVQLWGAALPSTAIIRTVSAQSETVLSGSTIVPLSAGASLCLGIYDVDGNTITLSGGVSASLSLLKLS